MKRTHYCGEVTEINENKTVTVGGFVQKIRDMGELIFIDLRDRTGIVQVTITDKGLIQKAKSVRTEFVLEVSGKTTERENKNPNLKTGHLEIIADDVTILSKAHTTPFEINGKKLAGEEIRLKYRYLDLRRAELVQNIIKRHKIAQSAREYFYKNGFLEIETPMLMKSTPEGARDYLVPSRVHPGKFYALPQSPQIYKQLLMVSGFDRYFQIARCFRDEDLRADRQPEFSQIDLEMSFADVDDILEMVEGFIEYTFKSVLDIDIKLPLKRLSYDKAMSLYGSDKPDTRFGMELIKISDEASAIVAENSADILTRKELDKLTDFVKGIGAGGLAYIKNGKCSYKKYAEVEIPYAKPLGEKDIVFIIENNVSALGALRLELGKKLNLIPENLWNFLWITDFPFYDKDDDGNLIPMHHPFTMPNFDENGNVTTAKAFDLVLNGTELSSGSIRITDYELQEKMFTSLGLTKEEIDAKFGFLVEAYKYGSPPHGGMGIGLDRLAMLMCGADSLKDITAFPKVQNASELMSECPSEVDKENLDILGIKL
ncbi:MAG: aspartate--tRNA ligase [Ruminococcus sp.]|jgi:aspartyl-tRNA synthetase|nr:aspartate--tRNA ligase [Ruminococcus sp.]